MNWNQPCCEACWLDPDRPDSRAAVTDGRLHAPIPADPFAGLPQR